MYDSTILRYVLLDSYAASLTGCTPLLRLGDKQHAQLTELAATGSTADDVHF